MICTLPSLPTQLLPWLLSSSPVKGKFDTQPINSSIQVGRSLELLCTGSARSALSEIPTFEWEYSNDPNPNRVTRKNEIGFGYVSITNVQVTDEQDYTCLGRNGKGVIDFTVDVRISGKLPTVFPGFSLK